MWTARGFPAGRVQKPGKTRSMFPQLLHTKPPPAHNQLLRLNNRFLIFLPCRMNYSHRIHADRRSRAFFNQLQQDMPQALKSPL